MKRPTRAQLLLPLTLSLIPIATCSTLTLDLSTARLLSLDSDIREVQERWRQYRNIVTDGFFLNDSMIVLNDYSSQEEEIEDEEENGLDLDKSKIDNEGDGIGDDDDFGKETGDLEESGLEEGGFKETMMEMMEALADIQTKGDLMMGTIRSQRELLYNVREELKEEEERLGMMKRQRKEEERLVEEVERQRILAEARTRMIQMEREEVERELEEVEREREEGEMRLEKVKEEVEAVLGEVEDSSQEISRLFIQSSLDGHFHKKYPKQMTKKGVLLMPLMITICFWNPLQA